MSLHRFKLYGIINASIHPTTVALTETRDSIHTLDLVLRDTPFKRDVLPRREGIYIPFLTTRVSPGVHYFSKAFSLLTSQ